MLYNHTIVGDPDDGFTSAEIEDTSGTYMGRVFELEDGWYIQVNEPEILRNPKLVEALITAKLELEDYVNRKGADFSIGEWTRAGISLW